VRLEGIHHITAITADAPRNVDFYARLLGLRLVKKTVNQDDPSVYHLFYADEEGSPGADLTFFEYPGAPRGRVGAGMVERIVWRVSSRETIEFWRERLEREVEAIETTDDGIRFQDPEGLGLELRVSDADDEPLRAASPDIPAEHALLGFDGVRALATDVDVDASLLSSTLGLRAVGDDGAGSLSEARGEHRGGTIEYLQTADRGRAGAGTVHHVAWASHDSEHPAWRERVAAAGMHVTPIIDRFYFKSIYFRVPSGVLFEIATHSPGFTADEPAGELGRRLSLPPAYEHLREQLERVLTPLPADPRRSPVATSSSGD
jgi:glyoxalase family protein